MEILKSATLFFFCLKIWLIQSLMPPVSNVWVCNKATVALYSHEWSRQLGQTEHFLWSMKLMFFSWELEEVAKKLLQTNPRTISKLLTAWRNQWNWREVSGSVLSTFDSLYVSLSAVYSVFHKVQSNAHKDGHIFVNRKVMLLKLFVYGDIYYAIDVYLKLICQLRGCVFDDLYKREVLFQAL